jgi:hypothetical protein
LARISRAECNLWRPRFQGGPAEIGQSKEKPRLRKKVGKLWPSGWAACRALSSDQPEKDA